MNSVQLLLIDLVQIAEAPLHSAYWWLGDQLGRHLAMSQFLRLVDELLARNVLRLWVVDHRSHDRIELFGVPHGLEDRYRAVEELDGGFDPFGLSLTLGAAADIDAVPEWEVDFDFEEGRFGLLAEPGAEDVALRQAARYFPEVTLEPAEREQLGDRIRIAGRIDVR